jgi:SEC-C motif
VGTLPKTGRNELCPCGSGEKYKRCCLNRRTGAPAQSILATPPFPPPSSEEPYVQHIRSIVWKGKRARVVWNKIHLRPPSETFHEFLVGVAMRTLGERWWHHQKGTAASSRHVVMVWWDAFGQATRRSPIQTVPTDHGDRFRATASGPAIALLSMGYDLFCLQAKNRLPDSLIERLRRNRDFQSVRYEIAVAATMVRAGFEIEFLDDAASERRHCEFIATCTLTGIRFAVEAKSRVRAGVLHQRGEFAYDGDSQGLLKLLRDARGQTVEELPLIIFVDVNMPPTPEVGPDEKPWVRDLMSAADTLERRTDEKGEDDPYAMIVATNFGFHFGEHEANNAPTEFGFVHARRPRAPVSDPGPLDRIMWSVGRYGRVPAEL